VDPSLTSEEVWGSIYSVSTFNADGFSMDVVGTLSKVGSMFFKEHRPAWTAVEVKSLVAGMRFEIHVQAALP
jgi:enamine deaminase RidA (YjgF/YER057c/UK114 family)